jgi:hypothetical protein
MPPCFNRPPVEGRWLPTGRFHYVSPPSDAHPAIGYYKQIWRWHPRWFVDRCATHDGRGIGPNNENYPTAHNWNCSGCRLNPTETKT